jgi:hypothetical protein
MPWGLPRNSQFGLYDHPVEWVSCAAMPTSRRVTGSRRSREGGDTCAFEILAHRQDRH